MSDDAAALHAGLADLLVARGIVRTGRVEAAIRAVPRHRFVPGVPAQAAYAPHDAVVTRRNAAGIAVSSASAPSVVASMLEQLDVRPGDRVLEIGAGTGYNAALLAELAGPAGRVVTVDLDADITNEAAAALATSGYGQVEVACGDGAAGHAAGGPYDRIIVTAEAREIPAAWWEQLAPGGRLVVPLLVASVTARVVAFERKGGRLAGRSMTVAGFVPLRGAGAGAGLILTLADGVRLLPGSACPAPPGALARSLAMPAVRSWSGLRVRSGRPFSDLDLWLASRAPGFCRIAARPEAVAADVATPAARSAGAAICDETGSLAYLTIRALSSDGDGVHYELGVRAHGPRGGDLTDVLAAQLRRWDRDYRSAAPCIEARPAQASAPLAVTVTWADAADG